MGEKVIASNDALTKDLLSTACSLLSASSGSFLFSDELCSADGFFAAILFRLEQTDPKLFKELSQEFPAIAEYWEEFSQTDEAECVLPYTMGWAMRNGFKHGLPFKMIGLKMHLLSPPALPE